MAPQADSTTDSSPEPILAELSLSISRGSPVPLHHQLRQLLQDQIERGSLRPGQQLPHERQYAEYLGISLAPVRQALLDLVRLGLVFRVRGKGTFVRDDKVIEKISLLGSFTDSLRSQGLEPAFTVTCAAILAPPPEVRDAFEHKPRRLFRLDRVASVTDGPLALLTAWLDPARFPDLAAQDFSQVPLYATLERLYGVRMRRAPPHSRSRARPSTRTTARPRCRACCTGLTGSPSRWRATALAVSSSTSGSDRMTSTPAPVTGAPQDSNFTRNATGLVREVSMWDALIMNTLGMNVAVGSVLLLQQAPAIFPGGNLWLAVIIGTVIMAFTLLWV